MRLSIVALLFLPTGLFCSIRQQDTTATVVGRVRDYEGRAVAVAMVSALDLRVSASTDSLGRFALRGLPAGSRHLRVQALGFDPVDTILTLRRGERRTWNVTLSIPEWVARAAREDSARVAEGGVDSVAMGFVKTDTTIAFTYERFGIELLRAAIDSGSSESTRVVSPLSVGQALSLALAAAKDSTAFAIARALHLGAIGMDGIAARSQRFNQALRARRDVKLTVANALWVDTSATLQPAFDGWARQKYGAAVRRLPLRVPSIVPIINAWADSATRGVIRQIRDTAFDSTTVVALTNAVYFKGLWLEPFDSARTQVRDFTTASGTRIGTPTMERSGYLAYRRAPGYQALRVPYKAGLTAMYIVLPDSSVSAATVLDGLMRTGWPIPNPSRETRSVALRLPRVHVAQALDLHPPLQRLNLGIVFDPNRADFGGLIVPGPARPPMCPPLSAGPFVGDCTRIQISEATQQVYVDVDEKGTEAAAVTSFGFITITSAPPPPIPFFVDRPFFFALRDERSGTFLFLGWVARPRAS